MRNDKYKGTKTINIEATGQEIKFSKSQVTKLYGADFLATAQSKGLDTDQLAIDIIFRMLIAKAMTKEA